MSDFLWDFPQTMTVAERQRLARRAAERLRKKGKHLSPVEIEGNKIAAIDTTNSAPPSDATVLDCGDRVLMPGLIDAHWHTLYAAVPMQVLLGGVGRLAVDARFGGKGLGGALIADAVARGLAAEAAAHARGKRVVASGPTSSVDRTFCRRFHDTGRMISWPTHTHTH